MDTPPPTLVALLAAALYQAERDRDRRRTDAEMAELYGLSPRAWRAAVAADPEVLRASLEVAIPGRKKRLRLWRAWEVEMRWSGAPRAGKGFQHGQFV